MKRGLKSTDDFSVAYLCCEGECRYKVTKHINVTRKTGVCAVCGHRRSSVIEVGGNSILNSGAFSKRCRENGMVGSEAE